MNSQPRPDLDYAASLRDYLEDPDESALAAAYALGCVALDDGAGVTNLSTMANEIVADLREQQPDRNPDVRIADPLFADADPDLIRIALTNLLSNAFKFTANQPAPQIDFASEALGDEVVYYVRDNGAGFDMAYVYKVFRPFERLHSQEDFPGTGIGLATVHRAISRHGGRIWAEATVDGGATFFFTLK